MCNQILLSTLVNTPTNNLLDIRRFENISWTFPNTPFFLPALQNDFRIIPNMNQNNYNRLDYEIITVIQHICGVYQETNIAVKIISPNVRVINDTLYTNIFKIK